MSTLKVDNLQTTGGSGLYPALAWVSFNGTGTVSIQRSGGTSSITDGGTGNYTQNFQNSMSSQYYSVSGSAKSYVSAINNCTIAGASNQVNSTAALKVLTLTLNTSSAHTSGYDTNYVALQTHN